jgi:hypothetical protein
MVRRGMVRREMVRREMIRREMVRREMNPFGYGRPLLEAEPIDQSWNDFCRHDQSSNDFCRHVCRDNYVNKTL